MLETLAPPVSNYLNQHGGVADSSGLFVLSSGGNDITYAKNDFAGNLAAEHSYLAGQASALAAEIQLLQLKGAQSIAVYGIAGSGGWRPTTRPRSGRI